MTTIVEGLAQETREAQRRADLLREPYVVLEFPNTSQFLAVPEWELRPHELGRVRATAQPRPRR